MASLDLGEAVKGDAKKPRPFHEQPDQPKQKTNPLTFYLMPADHLRLKMLAVKSGKSMQTIFMDALDQYLTEHQEAPLERWNHRKR